MRTTVTAIAAIMGLLPVWGGPPRTPPKGRPASTRVEMPEPVLDTDLLDLPLDPEDPELPPPPPPPPPCAPDMPGAPARPPAFHGSSSHCPAPPRPGLFPGLQLDAKQREATTKLLETRRADLEKLHRQAMELEAQLRSAVEDAALPESQLRSLHDAAASARLKAALAHHQLVQELHGLLTPEQRAKAGRIRQARADLEKARRALEAEGPLGGAPGPGGEPQAPPPGKR